MEKSVERFCEVVKNNEYSYEAVTGEKHGEQELVGVNHTSAAQVYECPPDYYRSEQLGSKRPETVFNGGDLWVAHSETEEYHRTTVSDPKSLSFPSRSVDPVKFIHSDSKVNAVEKETVSGKKTVVAEVIPNKSNHTEISESKVKNCRVWIEIENLFPIKYLIEFDHGYSKGIWKKVEFNNKHKKYIPEEN